MRQSSRVVRSNSHSRSPVTSGAWSFDSWVPVTKRIPRTREPGESQKVGRTPSGGPLALTAASSIIPRSEWNRMPWGDQGRTTEPSADRAPVTLLHVLRPDLCGAEFVVRVRLPGRELGGGSLHGSRRATWAEPTSPRARPSGASRIKLGSPAIAPRSRAGSSGASPCADQLPGRSPRVGRAPAE